MTPDTNHNKAITQTLRWDNISTAYDPKRILSEAEKELNETPPGTKEYAFATTVYKAFTLKEFENGVLLTESLKDEYKTFAIDFSRNIQKEYDCTTPSQKATAESIACAYCRILQSSAMMSRYLAKGSVTDYGLKYLAIMSKELDRAQRHYTTALQTLYMLKQPPLSVTVKANIANIANQQVIQERIDGKI
jgi:hypothetical protein